MIGRVVAVGYVATAATLGAVGFATDSSTPILVAGALTLPASIPAVVTFYAAYGLLALVPGANPSTGTGTGS